jgi:thiol-disulfide isomerase/thioredoxin
MSTSEFTTEQTTANELIEECYWAKDKKTGETIRRKDVNGEELPKLPFDQWNLYKLDQNCTKVIDKYGIFRVIEKVINKDAHEKPVLVAMAGFSVNSFCGSCNIIMSNLDKLENKYKAVYVICYDEKQFKAIQNGAFVNIDQRDEGIRSSTDVETRAEAYKEEVEMYTELGSIVDKVIRCMGLTNVHLLGKSAGGGVAMNVVYNSDIYTRLYLAVPAHPTFCESIKKVGNRLNKMKVIIGWNANDEENLGKIKSNQNINYFKPILEEIQQKNEGFQFDLHIFEPGNKHEINPELLVLIGKDI